MAPPTLRASPGRRRQRILFDAARLLINFRSWRSGSYLLSAVVSVLFNSQTRVTTGASHSNTSLPRFDSRVISALRDQEPIIRRLID